MRLELSRVMGNVQTDVPYFCSGTAPEIWQTLSGNSAKCLKFRPKKPVDTFRTQPTHVAIPPEFHKTAAAGCRSQQSQTVEYAIDIPRLSS